MLRYLRTSALTVLLCLACAVEAQVSWPDFNPPPMPGASVSPVQVSLPPDVKINPPAAELPTTRSRWSGKWTGWACGGAACDTKLAVEAVMPEGATIIYVFGSASVKPNAVRVDAKFVGEELHATLPSGSRIAYRFRADDSIDFLWIGRSNNVVGGVLSKER